MLEGQKATIMEDHGSQRRCGDCQLCCKLLPVLSIGKPANTRCTQQRVGKGCMVYRTALPYECSLWSCKWLLGGPDMAGLKRPDRVHYVIDAMPDALGMAGVDGVEINNVMVAQVWVDPAFPDAHRDPDLRAWMVLIAERDRMPTVVRWGSERALFVCPPILNDKAMWIEQAVVFADDDDGKPRNRLIEMMRGRA
jgi:hypothetical protein